MCSAATYHGEIPFPGGAAVAVTPWTGPLEGVATTLGTVQGHVVFDPRYATRETTAQLQSELFNGQNVIISTASLHLGPTRDIVQTMAQRSH